MSKRQSPTYKKYAKRVGTLFWDMYLEEATNERRINDYCLGMIVGIKKRGSYYIYKVESITGPTVGINSTWCCSCLTYEANIAKGYHTPVDKNLPNDGKPEKKVITYSTRPLTK